MSDTMKLCELYRSGNILTAEYRDEENGRKNKEYILAYRHCLRIYHEFEYVYESMVDVGLMAMAVILDRKYQEEHFLMDEAIPLCKECVMLFAGESEEEVEEKLKPFIAEKKDVSRELKIIDFEISGRQMKLYLADPDCMDYWGDDWNDTPYEHNAGTVYCEFVRDTVVVNFPQDTDLRKACDGFTNSPWSKEDFKKGKSPFAYIVPPYEADLSWNPHSRRFIGKNPNIRSFSYEEKIGKLYEAGYLITSD